LLRYFFCQACLRWENAKDFPSHPAAWLTPVLQAIITRQVVLQQNVVHDITRCQHPYRHGMVGLVQQYLLHACCKPKITLHDDAAQQLIQAAANDGDF
jgi:hypothetical protein